MNISFSGYKDVFIGRKVVPESIMGSYIDQNAEVKVGKKQTEWIKVSAKLNDDENGADLSSFKEYLSQTSANLQELCVRSDMPDSVDLILRQTFVEKGNKKKVVNSSFKLNGIDVELTSRERLPLYSFMARMVSGVKNDGNRSGLQTELLDRFDKAIYDKAMYYIDNLMPISGDDV
ncbi:MAG: hypothetical protein E7Z87_02780 [Cyanobacteria bacterium SIG26]|nr:hypothetical protein [Cyanobacteria bacterium SIG26]MBQ7126045.1 hypothetical protein [bacterium]